MYNKFSRAAEYALALPPRTDYAPVVVKVGNKYIGMLAYSGTSLDLLKPGQYPDGSVHGNYTGTVTLGHLERLGNANHAKGGLPFSGEKVFGS